jgi:hypothetical protein
MLIRYFAGPAVKEYAQLHEATITCMLKMGEFIVVIRLNLNQVIEESSFFKHVIFYFKKKPETTIFQGFFF